MLYKKLIIILYAIAGLFVLTGCYDATSIENSHYVVALGIDSMSNSDNINLSIQIATNSSNNQEGSSQSNEYKIYQLECSSINSGINIFNNYLNKQINLSHCSAIVFSEEIAKKGIVDLVNTLQNNIQIRPNCDVIISNKLAYNVLENVSNSGENFSARYYEHIPNSAKYTGYTLECNFRNFFTNMNNPGNCPIAIYSAIDDKTVQNIGMAVFKEDKMIGTFDTKGVISHLLLTNKLKNSVISIKSPFDNNKLIDLSISRTKKTDYDITINNNIPFIKIKVYLTASIENAHKDVDYSSSDNIIKLEKSINSYIENIVYDYLNISAKQYSADIVSIGDKLAIKYKTLDDFNKVNWDNIYKDSIFDISCESSVVSSSLITKQ